LRSRGRSRASHASCCSTSRCRRSTRGPAPTPGGSWARC
jgi:hypothetical protein